MPIISILISMHTIFAEKYLHDQAFLILSSSVSLPGRLPGSPSWVIDVNTHIIRWETRERMLARPRHRCSVDVISSRLLMIPAEMVVLASPSPLIPSHVSSSIFNDSYDRQIITGAWGHPISPVCLSTLSLQSFLWCPETVLWPNTCVEVMLVITDRELLFRA